MPEKRFWTFALPIIDAADQFKIAIIIGFTLSFIRK
jgi:hypothetical protein